MEPLSHSFCQSSVNTLDLATHYNTTGVASILLLSFLVARTYPSAFFRTWTRAYTGGLTLLLMEFAATRVGRPAWLVLAEIALVAGICWYFVQTGLILQHREPLPKRWGATAVAASIATGGVLVACQLPFTATFGPFVVVYSLLHIWLGYRMARASQEASASGASYLGFPLIASGVWFFFYPVVEGSAFAWVGYLVSAVLNHTVGAGMLVFLVEDTARKLRVKNEELTQLDKLKSLFITAMGHEFKTPLTSVSTAVWLLRNGSPVPPTPFQEELIGTVHEQTQVLNRLHNDILDYARTETGTFAYEIENVSLHQLVDQVGQAMRPAFEQAALRFEWEVPDSDVMADVDRDRIKQVLMNLLGNALKFVPSGGEVRLELTEMPDSVTISVSNTGPGIAPEHHERIFERFYQVPLGKTKAAGLGLGLAVSRAIIEDGHHGELMFDPSVTLGTRFLVNLPKHATRNQPELFPPAKVGL